MPIADWTAGDDWDTCYLAGKALPGTARVNVRMKSGIDTKKAKGAKKATQKDTGAPPAQVRIELELMPDELSEFEREVVPLIRPRNLFAPRDPLEIAHPMTRLWGINVVIGGEIESEHPKPGGTKVVTFTVEEYADPTKVNKSATKPKDDNEDQDWNVQPLIDALRPGKAGAAAANF